MKFLCIVMQGALFVLVSNELSRQNWGLFLGAVFLNAFLLGMISYFAYKAGSEHVN